MKLTVPTPFDFGPKEERESRERVSAHFAKSEWRPVPATTPQEWKEQDAARERLYSLVEQVSRAQGRMFPVHMYGPQDEQSRANVCGIVNEIGRPGEPRVDCLNRLTADELDRAALAIAAYFGIEGEGKWER